MEDNLMSNEFIEKPTYFGIIPANVRYDRNLCMGEKVMYSEFTALSNKAGYCWATNQYFATLYGVDSRTISRWINNLKNLGYIKVEIEYKDSSKEVKSRKIWIVDSSGIINVPTINNGPTETNQSVKEEKYTDEIKEIIDYLNNKIGSNYRYKTESTNKLIRARLNEGFTVDNFKQVINTKCAGWINDPKMSGYLRPSTLFGNKFEQYLNEKVKQSAQSQVTRKEWDGKFYSDEKF